MPLKSEKSAGGSPIRKNGPSGLNRGACFVWASPPGPSAPIPAAKIPSVNKMVVSFIALISFSESSKNSRSRMIFRVAHDGDAAAVGSYHVTFGHGVFGVVSAFGVHVGLEREQQLFDRRLVENGHVSHGFKRVDEF